MVIRQDFTTLCHAEKDRLNAELYDKIDAMARIIEKLEKRVDELEARLALNIKNSSKPPSSDYRRKPADRPAKGANPPGGKPGHKGSGLMKVAADELAGIVEHKPPSSCQNCGKKLPAPTGCDIPGRQVFDLPSMAYEAVERLVQVHPPIHP